MFETLLIVLLALALILFFYLGCYWSTHVDMNLDEHLPYDFVTFKTFMKEFEKYKDDPNLQKYEWNGKSIFLRGVGEYIVYLHANIVKFNGKCMIFYPLDYIKYCLWMKKFNKKPKKRYRVKGLWR